MIKTKYLLIGIIVLVLVGLGVAIALTQNKTPEPIITTSGTNPEATFSPPTSDQVSVETQDIKQPQAVNNFYKDSTFTYPDGNVVIEENEYYQLAYVASERLFIISIYDSNTQEGQDLAEKAFLAKLNISQTQACNLNTQVQIHKSLSYNTVPEEGHLSFCK